MSPSDGHKKSKHLQSGDCDMDGCVFWPALTNMEVSKTRGPQNGPRYYDSYCKHSKKRAPSFGNCHMVDGSLPFN